MDRRRFSVIQSRVSLVLSLTDTYTGGPPLRSSCLVRAEGREIRPLYKDGGYVVFQNLPGEPIRFCVESPYYADETVSVDLSAVENGYPVLPVPLTPSAAYPFPARDDLAESFHS